MTGMLAVFFRVLVVLTKLMSVILKHTASEGSSICMKENILSQWTDGWREIRDEWRPDRGSYLKAHLGWNRNLEQSPLKCELSSRMGVKGREDMDVGNDREGKKKNQIPQHQPPGDTRIADIRRTNVYQMDRGSHFQLHIKAGLAPEGLLAVSTKKIVIACVSWERDGECALKNKIKTKLHFCLRAKKVDKGRQPKRMMTEASVNCILLGTKLVLEGFEPKSNGCSVLSTARRLWWVAEHQNGWPLFIH